MTGKRLAVIPLVLLSFLAAPSHAATDEIRIIRGSLYQSVDITGELSIAGTNGMSMDAALPSRWSSLWWDYQCNYAGCLPGDVVNLRSSYGFTDVDLSGLIIGVGQVTIHGQTYSLWVPGGGGARAQLQFDGVLVAPEMTPGTFGSTVEASAPFTFSGSVQLPNQKEPGAVDVFALRGQGVATVLLSRWRLDTWHVSAVTYTFAPRGAVIQ
jgi:hypothetical protein